jgi:hypothetical protein
MPTPRWGLLGPAPGAGGKQTRGVRICDRIGAAEDDLSTPPRSPLRHKTAMCNTLTCCYAIRRLGTPAPVRPGAES